MLHGIESDGGNHRENLISPFKVLETSAVLDEKPSFWSVWARRYHSTHKCVSSKAALLTLLWSFIVGLAYGLLCQPANYTNLVVGTTVIIAIIYAGNAIILLFYPLAGFLADNKFGRYKTIVRSLYVLLVLLMIGFIAAVILVTLLIFDLFDGTVFVVIAVGVVVFLPFTLSFVGFNANVIQFGMDQLHDSPGDHQSLFIHWYAWLYYLGLFITQLAWNLILYFNYMSNIYDYDVSICTLYTGIGLMVFIPTMVLIVLIVSLCVARHRQGWFLVDPPRLNPYKLVHEVSKFARQHKVPVQRSAFTYCEDEVPSGLDLGKDKYGGPFTTEQVEDVKAFYGILKVLFALGLVFYLDIATDPLLFFYARHISRVISIHTVQIYNSTFFFEVEAYSGGLTKVFLLQNGLLSPLLIVFCIPIYLCLIRPFVSKYVPGMLKRMGLGILLMITSLVCTFVMDIVDHAKDRHTFSCMVSSYEDRHNSTSHGGLQDMSALIVQRSLSSLSNMLIYIALYEFICSQSPHSMKGLLIGLSFAIRGLFEVIAAVMVIPFSLISQPFPSCGMDYYLMNIGVGLVAVLVYMCVARRYKFRERDEPCNVHRYVEEYYSNILQEREYD